MSGYLTLLGHTKLIDVETGCAVLRHKIGTNEPAYLANTLTVDLVSNSAIVGQVGTDIWFVRDNTLHFTADSFATTTAVATIDGFGALIYQSFYYNSGTYYFNDTGSPRVLTSSNKYAWSVVTTLIDSTPIAAVLAVGTSRMLVQLVDGAAWTCDFSFFNPVSVPAISFIESAAAIGDVALASTGWYVFTVNLDTGVSSQVYDNSAFGQNMLVTGDGTTVFALEVGGCG